MKRTMAVAFAMTLMFSGAACSSKSDNAGKCPSQSQVDSWQKDMDEFGLDDPSDVDFKKMKDKAGKVLSEMGSYLPKDLRSELDSARKAMLDYFDILAGIDMSDPSSIDEETMNKLENNDFDKYDGTMDKVQDYFKDTCPDIDFGWDDEDSTSAVDTETSDTVD